MNTILRVLSMGFLYLTVHLVCLTSSSGIPCSRMAAPPNASCTNMFQVHCLAAQSKELLVGQGPLTLQCLLSPPFVFKIRRTSCNSGMNEVIVNGPDYMVNGQELTILSPRTKDEGIYSCENELGTPTISCVYVSGLARFKTCDAGTPEAFDYVSASVSRMNSCYEELNVTEGKVTLDTRILFMDGGCCGCRENVRRMAVRFDQPNSEIQFSCTEDNVLCTNGEDQNNIVNVSRHSDHPFDISLEVNLISSDSVQTIYVEIEVDMPRASTVRKFWKVFEVTVNEDLTTPSPTTVPSSTMLTTSSVTTSATTMTSSNPSDGTTGTTGGSLGIGGLATDSNASVTGGAIGAVVAIVLIIVGVVVLVVTVLLSRRHRMGSKDLKQTKEEVHYDTVDIRLPPTTQVGEVHVYRESVYNFDGGSHHLELHLESTVSAKV